MADALTLENGIELAFNALTAAVGTAVIVVGLRVTSKLTLSAHRLALRISFFAVGLFMLSNLARVWADFSRRSTFKDVGGTVAELVAVCSVGLEVLLLDRAAKRRVKLYEGNGLTLACSVLDLDDFKSYNDRHGHGRGDAVLCCLAWVLGKCTRADDLVARYGATSSL